MATLLQLEREIWLWRYAVKTFVMYLCLAAAPLILAAAVRPADAQQADQDASATAPQESDPVAQHANEGQIPASGEATTEETKFFSGLIVQENGEVVLQDPVTKVTHKLDDTAKAKQFMGKRVKVTGKLDKDSNTIRVESIEVLS
jgi:hypothetical protein